MPYPRIVPALFLRNYLIYSAKDTADIDVLRSYAKIFCLEEKFPKAAPKIHAASYLLGNYAFQAFLKSRREPFRLMMHRTTPAIVKKLEDQHIDWFGNNPESFSRVWLRADFHKLLKESGLPHLGALRLSREESLKKTFEDLYRTWNQPMTAQRIYPQTGIEQSPFFVRTQEDWADAQHVFSLDEKFSEIQVSPMIKGLLISMIGCVTHSGVLSSSLQLQFIDVPEVLQGKSPTGLLLGYDFGFHSWGQGIEDIATNITESAGEFLSKEGFRGMFGVNFIYEPKASTLFAIDCIPQFPEDSHIYSIASMAYQEIPPLEFFHIMACLDIKESFDFKGVNARLKAYMPFSHIFLLREGIEEMKLPLAAGIYSFSQDKKALVFKRPGAFPWELENDSEFFMIDSMPRFGKRVIDNVPSLFKLIFPSSIAESSSKIKPHAGELITLLSATLRK